MERKYSCNDPLASLDMLALTRRSTIGYQTEQLNRMDYVIGEIVLQTNFKMGSFITACNQYPQIRDQTKLIHEIFLKPNFVEDLIRFLMVPGKMVAKFGLSAEEARRYVTTIASFLKENFEFYEYYFLSLEKGALNMEVWFQFLNEPQASTLYTSLGYLYDIFLPFVKYEYSTSSRVTEYFEKHALDRGILLIDHFEQGLLKKMLQATQYEAIFKVLLNLVLVSMQEQEWKKSLALLKALCMSGISLGATLDSHVESLFLIVKEVDNNIDKDNNKTIFAFINVFVQADLVKASINRIVSVFESSQSMRNTNLFSIDEEWALQSNFKLLGEIVNLYSQLRGTGIDPTATQMMKLKQSIMQVYLSFGRILKLIRKCNFRSLNFSNGENIRSIALYRHEFLNLLRISLQLIKQHGQACPQLLPTLDKTEILQFLTRCLSENRWNSIVHCTIEKIVCLMINTEFFKTRGASIRKFLLFLVQAFSNKKYMFLNSAKMINQGDIHSLYFIARKITVQLDRMPVIVDATNDFDFWKDFVLKVLQKYEHFCEERSSKVEWQEEERDRDKENGDFRVEIDEVALIKEIVKKIEVNKKWSFKKDSHSTIYRIGSASQLKKLRTSQKTSKSSTPGLPSRFRISINEQKPMVSINEVASETSVISLKGMSMNEEKEMSASNHSSEEQVLQLSAHSDADQLEQEGKSEPKKMTQSGW